MATFYRELYKSQGTTVVLKAEIVVGADFAKSAANYWTLTLTRIPTDEDYNLGETVGTALSTATRDLTAGVAEILYDDATGFVLQDGERLVFKRASTGTPAALTDAKVVIDRQRLVR